MKNIMVVDDEKDTRLTIKSVLEDEGFNVTIAINGDDCLKKLKTIKPDLIILDIMMPGITVKEILSSIKKNKKTNKVKIIFLTVVRFAELTQKNLMGGIVVDFIEKPFTNDNLIRRVKRALNIK